MQALRTPDERFAGLADYPFAPHYTEVGDFESGGLRLHHVEQGSGRPVLLMHGEPTWSYLYRRFLPALAAKGLRPIAPDLIGFGRSDKPKEPSDYSYERHVDWMAQWLEAVDLRDAVLFGQDWGGLIGLRLLAAFPERFAGAIISNTGLPVGRGWTEAFGAWLTYSQSVPSLPIGRLINGGCARELTPDEVAAYDAPFPADSYQAGALRFPTLVPITPRHGSVAANKTAWIALEHYEKPFLTAFSDADPVTAGADVEFQQRVPGAKGQPHQTIAGARHFVQEDAADQLCGIIAEFTATLP